MKEVNTENMVEDLSKTEWVGMGDLICASLIAASTFALQWLFEYPIIDPGTWEDAAVALEIRPAMYAIPGYWTTVVWCLNRIFGIEHIFTLIRILGHLSLTAIAFIVYIVIREFLSFIMRIRPRISRRCAMVSRFAAVIGTFAFVLSDPLWALGQGFCEETLMLLLTVASLESFLAFMRKGTPGFAYLAAILLGLLAAETAIGMALPCILIVLYAAIIARHPQLEFPLLDPAVFEVGKWHMTFLFLMALLVGIGINATTFTFCHGIEAAGKTVGDLPLEYILCYWQRFAKCATPLAGVAFVVGFVVPFAVCSLQLSTASDEARFLPYAIGLVFIVCGLLAYSQCVAVPALWLWTHFQIASGYLLSIGCLLCSLTIAMALTVLGVDAFCRNHRRLAMDIYNTQDDCDDDELESERGEKNDEFADQPSISTMRIVAFAGMLAVMLLAIIPGRVKTVTREMLAIVGDAIGETVREAGDATCLFTDGNLDAGIEIESARRSGKLRCYSMMGGSSPVDAFLRQRGLTDDEDRLSFGFDTGIGLRSWIRDKPERLRASAVQMGFDLWKRDGRVLPPMGGVLSRPTGFPSEEERLRGVAEAHRLADRILALNLRRMGIFGCTEQSVRRAFFDVQWRLARMSIYRGEVDDMAGNADGAIAEAEIAKRLNEFNPTYQSVVTAVEKRNFQVLRKVSPREGLQLALVRADFCVGRIYAEAILSADPENSDANFCLGMFYRGEGQLSRAEAYLRRCLVRNPEEPAVHNNLAMINIERGELDKAAADLKHALRLLPKSVVVRRTQKALEAAIAKAKAQPSVNRKEVAD